MEDKRQAVAQNAEVLTWARKIGVHIRTRRKHLGLNLEDLSRLSGSTVPTLSHIERGTRDVKLSTLVSIAAALRTDLSDLIDGTPPEQITRHTAVSHHGGYDLEDD